MAVVLLSEASNIPWPWIIWLELAARLSVSPVVRKPLSNPSGPVVARPALGTVLLSPSIVVWAELKCGLLPKPVWVECGVAFGCLP